MARARGAQTILVMFNPESLVGGQPAARYEDKAPVVSMAAANF